MIADRFLRVRTGLRGSLIPRRGFHFSATLLADFTLAHGFEFRCSAVRQIEQIRFASAMRALLAIVRRASWRVCRFLQTMPPSQPFEATRCSSATVVNFHRGINLARSWA